jgi:hypothetical protein
MRLGWRQDSFAPRLRPLPGALSTCCVCVCVRERERERESGISYLSETRRTRGTTFGFQEGQLLGFNFTLKFGFCFCALGFRVENLGRRVTCRQRDGHEGKRERGRGPWSGRHLASADAACRRHPNCHVARCPTDRESLRSARN